MRVALTFSALRGEPASKTEFYVLFLQSARHAIQRAKLQTRATRSPARPETSVGVRQTDSLNRNAKAALMFTKRPTDPAFDVRKQDVLLVRLGRLLLRGERTFLGQ